MEKQKHKNNKNTAVAKDLRFLTPTLLESIKLLKKTK